MGRLLLKIAPHFYFLAYFALCLATSRERILYADSAYYLFEMIQQGSFYVPHHRYLALLGELLPLAAIRLELPLGTVVQLYALNLALLPYLCFLAVRHLLKLPLFSLAFVVLTSVCVHHAFFNPIAEIVVGLNIALLWTALLLRAGQAGWNRLLTALACAVLAMLFITHPVTIAAAMIVTLLLLRRGSTAPVLPAVSIIALLVIKVLSFNAYEQGKWSALDPASFSLDAVLQNYVTEFLLRSMATTLLPATIMAVVLLIILWKRKDRLTALALAALWPAFILFASLLNYRHPSFYAYVEGYYTPFLYIAVSILFAVLTSVCTVRRRQNLAVAGVWLLGMLSLGRLAAEPGYREKEMLLDKVLEEAAATGCQKVILHSGSEALLPHLLVKWSAPFETLLRSSMNGRASATMFYDGYELEEPIDLGDHVMLGADWCRQIPAPDLNPAYFELPSGSYCRISVDPATYKMEVSAATSGTRSF